MDLFYQDIPVTKWGGYSNYSCLTKYNIKSKKKLLNILQIFFCTFETLFQSYISELTFNEIEY